jgi:hypothetical protein
VTVIVQHGNDRHLLSRHAGVAVEVVTRVLERLSRVVADNEAIALGKSAKGALGSSAPALGLESPLERTAVNHGKDFNDPFWPKIKQRIMAFRAFVSKDQEQRKA